MDASLSLYRKNIPEDFNPKFWPGNFVPLNLFWAAIIVVIIPINMQSLHPWHIFVYGPFIPAENDV